MQNFNCLASIQTDLDKFLTLKLQNFSGYPNPNFIFFPKSRKPIYVQLAKHVHAEFQLSTFYPDGLGKIFNLLKEKFKILLRKLQNFPILKQVSYEASQKASFSKI
jgi:hypothetical protein